MVRRDQGRRLRHLTPAEQTAEQAREIMARLQAGGSWSGEFEVRRRDGTTFAAHVTNSPVMDVNGTLTGIIGISHDLTDQKRLEEQLLHAQKMEAVGRLAGGVAHDFNNLLMVIDGNARFVLEDLPADSPSRADLEEVVVAAFLGQIPV